MKGYRDAFHLVKASAFAGALLGFVFGVDAQPDFEYRQITNTPPPKTSAGRYMSADGRYMALISNGDLFPGGNPEGNFEVFLFDAQTDQMTQVTNTTSGISAGPAISADGSRIVFQSNANLVPAVGNTDGSREIFLFDVPSGFQQLTSSPQDSQLASMSANGLLIVFESRGNLDSNPYTQNNPEGASEIFLYDALSGNIEQLTDSALPGGFVGASFSPRISADGSRVVFLSSSDTFLYNPEHSTEVVRIDLATYPRQYVQLTGGDFCTSDGNTAPCWADNPSISSDGARVAFNSNADLQPTVGNLDGSRELFLWDETPAPGDPTIRQVTNLPAGPSPLGDAFRVDTLGISADGMKIAFESNGNFDSAIGNADGNREIFLFDDTTGSFEQVTQTNQGTFESNKIPAFSPDGRIILFISDRDLDHSLGNADGNFEVFLALRPDPVLDPIGDRTVSEGQLLSFEVSATDADDDPLTLTARMANGDPLSAIGATFTDAGDGTGTFSWTPTVTQAGTYELTFTATDPEGLSDAETITITVQNVNRPPSLRLHDPDVNGDGAVSGLDFFAVLSAFNKSEAGAAAGGYTWADYEQYDVNGDRAVSGIDFFAVLNAFNVACWPTPTPSSPCTVSSPLSWPEGRALTLYLTATDPDGDPLTFTPGSLPAGAAFTNPDGPLEQHRRKLTWTPSFSQAGSYSLSVTASDGNLSDAEVLSVTVPNTPLAITSLTDTPDPFTPNNDTVQDSTTISATFNQPVESWTLTIKTTSTPPATVRTFGPTGAGSTAMSQVWNGKDSLGGRVSNGTYTYRLDATAASGSNGGSASASGTLTVQ